MTESARRPAIFLDRDGTLIEDRDYLGDPAGVSLLPGAAAGIRALAEAGFLLVVASNQSGVARGMFPESAVLAVNAAVDAALRAAGAPPIDAWYHCPHGPADGCDCRKPAPGLVLRAARERAIDLPRSFAVGDRGRDLEAARTAGVAGGFVLVGATAGEEGARARADLAARDLEEAARWIVARARRSG